MQATESIRAAARWLLTAFAAVGGALVAGVPLTDLGTLDVPSLRFFAAIAAILVALGAIALMIGTVARVFTARYVSFGDLALRDFPERTSSPQDAELEKLEQLVIESRNELFGAEAATLPELSRKLSKANEQLRGEEDPPPTLVDRQGRLEAATLQVLDFANYEHTRRTFQRLFPTLAWLGLLVVIAVGGFTVLIGQKPDEAPEVTEATPVTVSFPDSDSEVARRVGQECDLSAVEAVAVGGTLDAPEIVTVPTGSCSAIRLTVDEDDAVVVPDVPRPPQP
jgi:hypothetical protein